MGLTAGIVGLPNVGKSTIFNALCNGKALVENYPFCTIDPNHGIIAVPDDRLPRITAFSPTQKVVPAFLELVDIAGLVKGASNGEGLGNQFLGHIKDVDAVVHVVRCFEDKNITHVEGSADPLRDISIIETELMLADSDTVERGIDRLSKAAKSGDREIKERLLVFEKALEALSRAIPIRKLGLSTSEIKELSELHLLTSKPVLYVANIDEARVLDDGPFVKSVKDYAAAEKSGCVKISGKIEAEIADLPEDQRPEFLATIGLSEPGLNILARAIYKLLGLETFFTSGPKENRAWTISKGTTAPRAAGCIHSDFEKGFIKADVYRLEDLERYKTEAAMRAAGKIRSEGKDYVVMDGDIVFFKFNV
ncbi:MAG: redox-regulated ATPase YchF [Chitinivibrionales bacterium]